MYTQNRNRLTDRKQLVILKGKREEKKKMRGMGLTDTKYYV